ncbi:6-phosphogluconolactonase [Bordetella genomosp. 11]|uniref:6-phosphogluconolactonase n=1 Tax=Bordetella genomosp. 11 TaxID=1416808 RepID=A0A261UL50_9BORD|nr:6-phosphogluconolactonase [Bordetella genomosp. 11]OZI62257.1 6-phosphogluconolactonase [Bordetella genomosp. 11]
MNKEQACIFENANSLVEHLADWLTARIAACEGRFALALSGGSTPRPLYALLAEPERARRIDWSRVHLFWGDERFVPYDDPRSNYGMTRQAMIDSIPIPAENVHPVPTDGTPESAAKRYADLLREYYGSARLEPGRPLFDVNLLGIGDDGHTASLFPGAPQVDETRDWTVAVVGVKDEPRISLTFPALDSAAAVVFLAAGDKKRSAVSRARAHDPDVPSGRVRPQGELLWYLDRDAAGGDA